MSESERPYAMSSQEDNIAGEEFLTREESAAYLGVELRRLEPVAEEYGIARRYLTEPEPDWYYGKSDLDRIKASGFQEAPRQGRPGAPQ